MRAIFTNFGSRGDFEPLLTLAHELAAHNFEPLFAAPEFANNIVSSSGFEFVSIGPEALAGLRDHVNLLWTTQPGSYQTGKRLHKLLAPFRSYFHEGLEKLSGACRNAAVLISGPVQPIARMAHEITGIPFVSLQVCHFGGSGGPELREAGELLVNSFRREIGLSPIKDPLTTGANSPQLALYAMSARLRVRPRDWPAHYHMTGFFFPSGQRVEADPELVSFVQSGPPPVVFTFGSMVHENPDELRNLIVEAVHLSGCRAVVQGFGSNGLSSDTDAALYWADFVPHAWLFPRAACAVLHGGAGTSAVLFRAGIPGVFVPHGGFFDQRYWGQLANELGCAVPPIPIAELTPQNLCQAIRRSMEDKELRKAAAALAAAIRAERGVQAARLLIQQLINKIGLAA